jgi:glycosyltransferase involved in cell wall biosynthesis
MKKKILILHHSGLIGGAGVSLYNVAISLTQIYDLKIYCPPIPQDYSKFLIDKGFEVKYYNFPIGSIPYYSGSGNIFSIGFIKEIIKILLYYNKLKHLLSKEVYDILIVNSKTLSWISKILPKRNIISICFVRETRVKTIYNFWNNVQRHFLNIFKGVVFISDFDRIIEKLSNPLIEVIPNFVKDVLLHDEIYQFNFLKKYSISDNVFKILYVGGISKLKGFDLALDATSILINENVVLLVAGSSNIININYKNNIKSFSITQRKFMRKVSLLSTLLIKKKKIIYLGLNLDMHDVYSLADVLIFPVFYPHQGRPIFEAGAYKKPVIVPDFINFKEYVINEFNGLYFKKRNPNSLARSIYRIMKDGNLMKELGENNYLIFKKNHLKEHGENKLNQFIQELINNN